MKMLKILAVSLVILALAAGPVLAAEPQPQPQLQTVCLGVGRRYQQKSLCRLPGEAYLLLLLRLSRGIQKRPGKISEKDGGAGGYPGKVS